MVFYYIQASGAPNCTDGTQNGDETGVDCGGSSCSACETCDDGIQNQDETGIDCGGSSCSACESCDDGILNQDETDVDCGGSCPECSNSTGKTDFFFAKHIFFLLNNPKSLGFEE